MQLRLRPVLAVLAVASLAAVPLVSGFAPNAGAFAGKHETKPSVSYATSWEGALAEARALNVPIVVHNHGFYCGPCWGMHSSVLQNEDYIAFAKENTVEVIALGRLDEGISKNEARAAEYEATDADGKPVKYMVEFPGLTREQVLALDRSKASTYNDTGRVPFTCIVNPHDEKEMVRWSGGQSVKTIMEAVTAKRKELVSAHGPSLSREALRKTDAEVKRIEGALPKAGVQKSLADYRKLEKSLAKEPEALRARLAPALAAITEAAGKDLDAAEEKLGAGDAAGAKKILDRLGVKALEGTEVAERAKELVAKVAAALAPAAK